MPDRLLLRLDSDGGLSWLRHAGALPARSNRGVPPASALAGVGEILVLVPAEDVLLTEVTLGARSQAQLMQALPYAVEDQLLAPVEDLHFAALRGEGDRVGVAVVAKQVLRDWLRRLDEAGIRADRLLPESLLLPAVDGRAAAMIEADHAVVRLASWSGFGCRLAELPGWLAQVQAAGALPPMDVRDFRAQPPLALPVAIGRYDERQADALVALAASTPPALNLLCGEFAPRHRRAGVTNPWRLAAGLAAVVGLLAFANLGVEVLQLARTDARLQSEAAAIVRSAFPDVEAAQLDRLGPERFLRARLDGQRGGEASGLLSVLGRIAPVLGSTTQVQTRGMEYRNGRFELALRAANVGLIDGVRERLAAAGLVAEVTAANPGPDGVDGRIRIGDAP